MADNNIPISNNHQGNGIDVGALVNVINNLTQNQEETNRLLNTISRNLGNNRNGNNNNNSNYNQRRSSNNDNRNLSEYLRNIGKVNSEFNNILDTLNRFDRELRDNTNGTSNNFNQLNNYLNRFGSELKASYSTSIGADRQYTRNLNAALNNITNLKSSLADLNIQYVRANNQEKIRIRTQITQREAEIRTAENHLKDLQTGYAQQQEQSEQYIRQRRQEIDDLRDIANQRNTIEERNNRLLNETGNSFRSTLDNFRNSWNLRSGSNYQQQLRESIDTESAINEQIESLGAERVNNAELIASLETQFNNLEASVAHYTELLNDTSVTLSDDDRQAYEEALEEATRNREEARSNREILERRQEVIEEEQELLAENREYNRQYRQNLDRQFSLTTTLLKKAGQTIADIITKAIEREQERLIAAADKAFSAIEDTQKSLGKTLKMSSGAYQEFVDKIQASAKEAGVAIDQNQVLELAASLSELGIRDEGLITTLATEQAKIQEAGLNGIVQLNEDTIKQYQKQYLQDKQQYGEDVASANLEKRIDNLIATESLVSEKLGSATALANGGMAEILNRTTQMKGMGYISDETEDVFTANLAYIAQVFDNAGADFSTVLSDFDTLLNTTESNLSTQQKAVLNQMGTTSEIMEQYAKDPTAVISKYLAIVQSQYNNMDLTSMKYVQEALGDSYSAVQRATEQNAKISLGQSVSIEDLSETANKINKDLSSGTYLSATEKLEKSELELMQDIAQYAQTIPDGQFWMNNTLNAGKSLISQLASLLASFIGSAIAGNGRLGSFLTGRTPVGSDATSGWATAGKYLASSAGIVTATYGFGSTLAKGDISDMNTWEDALTNKTFTTGLGMALGGALGGPLGAAVGGAVSSTLIPTAQKGVDKIADYIWDINEDAAANEQQMIKEAAQSIKDASAELGNTAISQYQMLTQERDDAKGWNALQKEEWLKQHQSELDMTAEEIANLKSEADVNAAFQKAYTDYFSREENKLTNQLNIAEFGEAHSKQLAAFSKMSEGDIRTKEGGSKLISQLADSGTGVEDINKLISDYATTNKVTEKQATAAVLSQLGITDAGEQGVITGELDYWKELKNEYDTANKIFQDNWTTAKEAAGANADVVQIRDKYIEIFGKNNPYLNLDQAIDYSTASSGTPSLNSSNGKYYKGGYMVQVGQDEDAKWYPMYKVGLDYVPYDNYLALLHRGETILDAQEADTYRSNSNIQISDITNTLISQTDRIESMLTKIYTALLSIHGGGSRTTLNSNIVNMVSGIATL